MDSDFSEDLEHPVTFRSNFHLYSFKSLNLILITDFVFFFVIYTQSNAAININYP